MSPGLGPAAWTLWSWLWLLSTITAEMQMKPVVRKSRKNGGNALKGAGMGKERAQAVVNFLTL